MLFEELSEKILSACMEVHTEIGCGLLEAVYCEALGYEFKSRDVPFAREVDLPVVYKGRQLNRKYRVDFVCFDKIILEIKALDAILPIHKQQLFNYLKLANLRLGYVINFGGSSLKWERIPNLY